MADLPHHHLDRHHQLPRHQGDLPGRDRVPELQGDEGQVDLWNLQAEVNKSSHVFWSSSKQTLFWRLPDKLRDEDDLSSILQKAIGPLLNIEFPPSNSSLNATFGNQTFDNEEDYYEEAFSLNTSETVSLLKKVSFARSDAFPIN